MADDDVPSDSSILVVIVDTNPNQRYITEDPKVLTNCLDAVIAFANSHLMQKSRNQLAVIGCHFHKSEYLYPSPGKPLDVRQIDGQYELFTLVEKTIKMRLVNLIKSQQQEEKPGESLLAGALAMALCFIARLRRQAAPGLRTSARVLVVTGSGDTAAQYINYMNVFFTAQKQQVLIDVCSLDKHLSLLQQGCDITGGLYLKVPTVEGLLQYLLWVFLPDSSERNKLVLPGRGRVDYRAACFCHRELLTIGYVCSVCLSVFCKFSPICTTCHTVFKIGGPLPIKPKKKKMKNILGGDRDHAMQHLMCDCVALARIRMNLLSVAYLQESNRGVTTGKVMPKRSLRVEVCPLATIGSGPKLKISNQERNKVTY